MRRSQRDLLLDGAIECIQNKGAAATTARDIASAAGANLSSIPYHFGTKENLLDEAMLMALARWRANLGSIEIPDTDSPLGMFGQRVEAILASLPTTRPLPTSLFEVWARCVHNEAYRDKLSHDRRTALKIGAQLIEDDAESRGVSVDGKVAATVALAIFDGLILQWLLDPDEMPAPGDVVTALATLAQWAPRDPKLPEP